MNINIQNIIKKKYLLKYNIYLIRIGNIINITYSIIENNKKKYINYEGLIINIKNKGLHKTFTIRNNIQNIGFEQIFFFYSPNIINIKKIKSFNIKRSKLFYIRNIKKSIFNIFKENLLNNNLC